MPQAQGHLLQVAVIQHIREGPPWARGTQPPSTAVTLLNTVAFHQSLTILGASAFAELPGLRQDRENDVD